MCPQLIREINPVPAKCWLSPTPTQHRFVDIAIVDKLSAQSRPFTSDHDANSISFGIEAH